MRTRFAPSPTGPLHLGHAFSALTASQLAVTQGGEFLLRIEDIDQSRARAHWEDGIYDDLHWLGLDWPSPVLRQSSRADVYAAALDRLWEEGLLYACSCSRRDIKDAASAPQEGVEPHIGPDGIVYPGTCRGKPRSKMRPTGTALRLDLNKAISHLPEQIEWREQGVLAGRKSMDMKSALRTIGDAVLARPDMGAAYHLAVVIDDADQGITLVVRGEDLQPATPIHRILQILLGLPEPVYHHHRLIRDEAGKRLAKRDDARAIRKFREEGFSPSDIARMVGLSL